MSNTENLLVQIKVDHHQLVGDLRVEGQIHNENLLIHLVIHQAAKPLEPQKVHHLSKGQLGWVGSRKKISRNIRAYIVPVELHEKCHNAMVAACLLYTSLLYIVEALLHQCLRRNAFQMCIRDREIGTLAVQILHDGLSNLGRLQRVLVEVLASDGHGLLPRKRNAPAVIQFCGRSFIPNFNFHKNDSKR